MAYSLIKFIHVLAVIIWLGGAFTLSLLNYLVAQKKDISGLISLSKYAEFMGKFIISISAGITLLSGISLSVFFGFGWPFWVIWGFWIIILASILGSTVMRKISGKMNAIAQSKDPDYPKLHTLQRKFFIWNIIILILLFSAVWMMIFKPVF